MSEMPPSPGTVLLRIIGADGSLTTLQNLQGNIGTVVVEGYEQQAVPGTRAVEPIPEMHQALSRLVLNTAAAARQLAENTRADAQDSTVAAHEISLNLGALLAGMLAASPPDTNQSGRDELRAAVTDVTLYGQAVGGTTEDLNNAFEHYTRASELGDAICVILENLKKQFKDFAQAFSAGAEAQSRAAEAHGTTLPVLLGSAHDHIQQAAPHYL